MRACVITISDRCSKGEAEDKSGPALCTKLREWNPSVQLSDVQCVPDEAGVIRNKVQQVNSGIRFDTKLVVVQLTSFKIITGRQGLIKVQTFTDV